MCCSHPPRRIFLFSNVIMAITFVMVTLFGSTAAAQNYQNDINTTSNWMASSAVTLSDGAVVDGANSTRINPYFANLGVTGLSKDASYYFNIQYLMDNAEAYRGLRDLQNLYTALGATTKAQFYQTHADQMQSGILTHLWNSAANDFYSYTTVSGASGTVNWSAWYPDSVSQ